MKERTIFSLSVSLTLCLVALAVLLVLVADATYAGPSTRYVATSGTDGGDCTDPDAPCRTVQYGVDVAGEGDRIKIATGIYTGVNNRGGVTQTVYISKGLTLEGGYPTGDWTAPDPEAHPTTLDAEGQGRVMYAIGEIDLTIVGLRITGGNADELEGGEYGDAGGGLYVMSATLTLSDSQVVDNGIDGYRNGCGGGLYLHHTDATLAGNTISGNSINKVAQAFGGGLYMDGGELTLRGNTFRDNRAWAGNNGTGGGLVLFFGKAVLTGNTIADNSSSGWWGLGGGLLSQGCDLVLTGNTVTGNTTRGSRWAGAGGLHLESGSATLIGNTISRNTCDWGNHSARTDGLLLGGVQATLINNVIAGHPVRGLYLGSPSVKMLHTTLAGNGLAGNELKVVNGQVAMTNTIVVSATVGVNVQGGTVIMESTLWGSGPSANDVDWTGGGTLITGTRNYWADPGFVAPGAGDYHLGAGSAAIDRGIDAGVRTDIDGDPRPDRCGFDLGADEFMSGVECRHYYLPLMLRKEP